MKIDLEKIRPMIRKALQEDIGSGDITTNSIVPKDLKARAAIIVREEGIIAGLDVARLTFDLVECSIKFKSIVKDGEKVKVGKVVAHVDGNARGILKAERTALNFLGRLSGISTQTQ